MIVVTGLRIGELLALWWRSVDVDARELQVRETFYKDRLAQAGAKQQFAWDRWLPSLEVIIDEFRQTRFDRASVPAFG